MEPNEHTSDDDMTDDEFERLAELDFDEAVRLFVAGCASAARDTPGFAAAFIRDIEQFGAFTPAGFELRDSLDAVVRPFAGPPS